MGKIRVFEILDEFRALEEMLNEVDSVTGEFINSEDDIKEYIEKLNQDKETKLNNIEDLKLELKGQSETLKTKIDKLTNRKKAIESNIERLKDLQNMLLGGDKLKTSEYTFSYRTSKSVNILNEEDLASSNYVSFEPKIDKKTILNDLKNGIEIKGAEIVEKKSLTVR